LLKADINKNFGEEVKTNLGTFKFYKKLKDVPTDEIAMYEGSSGIGDKRFLEIAVQKGSAKDRLNVTKGQVFKVLG